MCKGLFLIPEDEIIMHENAPWPLTDHCSPRTRGHTYPVWSVACQRSVGGFGHYFVSGSMDRTARLWSYERAHQLRIFSGHTQDVDVSQSAVS